jgi:hypothetical protein
MPAVAFLEDLRAACETEANRLEKCLQVWLEESTPEKLKGQEQYKS